MVKAIDVIRAYEAAVLAHTGERICFAPAGGTSALAVKAAAGRVAKAEDLAREISLLGCRPAEYMAAQFEALMPMCRAKGMRRVPFAMVCTPGARARWRARAARDRIMYEGGKAGAVQSADAMEEGAAKLAARLEIASRLRAVDQSVAEGELELLLSAGVVPLAYAFAWARAYATRSAAILAAAAEFSSRPEARDVGKILLAHRRAARARGGRFANYV